jgi:hypothetical protein
VNTPSTAFSFCHDSPFEDGKRANQPCICLNGMLSDATYNAGFTLSNCFVLPAPVRQRR